jgi:adenylate kinase family enzyme
MKRIAVLGRGGAGKSVVARKLSAGLDLPVIELDSVFWQPGPRPTPEPEWVEIHRGLVERDRWIIDGDLGPYDSGLGVRLSAADTIVLLDFPLWRCALRTLRRSRETREYWAWVYRYPPGQLAIRHRRHREPRVAGGRSRPAQSAQVRRFLDCVTGKRRSA